MSKEYYDAPLIITYSGGKDSDVLLHLARTCLQKDEFEVLNSHTSVDAPETVYHIREVFKEMNNAGIKATVHFPKDKDGKHVTMWSLIVKKKMPPTRIQRYCCAELKETSTPNRICALGVRAAESTGRQGRDDFAIRGGTLEKAMFFSFDHAAEVHRESKEINEAAWDCTLIKTMKEKKDTLVNPIYKWTDADVWDYIKQNEVKVNVLYSRGYYRVGCIGCPMATYKQKQKQFADYPKYKQTYLQAFDKMLKAYKEIGDEARGGKWKDAQGVFDWWVQEEKHNIKGQLHFFDN